MTTLPPLALSVRQPWAWAIIHAGKNVENRDWRQPNPGLKFRGRVAIHAATGMTREEYINAGQFIRDTSDILPPNPAELARGAIIGSVLVAGIITKRAKAEAMPSPWFFGPCALILADPEPCGFVGAGGQLGMFAWTPNGQAPEPPARWMLPKQPIAATTKQGVLI